MWKRADFPWMGTGTVPAVAAVNGREVTRGMVFGVSPFAESRWQ